MINVNRLILIAGTTCAGKTTLIKKIREGFVQELSNQMEMVDPFSWKYIDAVKLHKDLKLPTGQLILHYDLLRCYDLLRSNDYKNDNVLNILDTSDEITILTLWVSSEILLQRIIQRRNEVFYSLLKPAHLINKIARLYRIQRKVQMYNDKIRVFKLYDNWFRFCDQYTVKAHWIGVSTGEILKLHPSDRWSDFTV